MTEINEIREQIKAGKTCLGIEFGSTRIKAILVDRECNPIASGGHNWRNRLENGIWTYSLDDIWIGLAKCYDSIKKDINNRYDVVPKTFKAMGVSAMMHGYLALNGDGKLLVPFRTWRNTMTEEASKKLTDLFSFPIPQRWSIAHLYQAMLGEEEHVKNIRFLDTLAGYVHWRLTGEFVLGIGDASGMFPIDSLNGGYNKDFLAKFDSLSKRYSWKIWDILPQPIKAGVEAGILTAEGAALLDRDGDLESGIPMCPAEGDAGTGMVATNSVKPKTGNVSAGTSAFAMIVLEKKPRKLYRQLDMVTTPEGRPVAMVHSNNCTGEYDRWIAMFREVIELAGLNISTGELYDMLLGTALNGDSDCGGLLAYGYLSGEHLTGFSEGRPFVVRRPESKFSLSNFMRAQLFTSLCALRTGLDLLFEREGVELDFITGHGGFFKTPEVGQRIMAAGTHTPCGVLSSAGEGGAWGIALLASYLGNDYGLGSYLEKKVFKNSHVAVVKASAEEIRGFDVFLDRYKKGASIEKAAVENL